jgi:ribonuclease R
VPLEPSVLLKALRSADHPLGLQDLLRRAGLPSARRASAERALAELVRNGTVRREGKRFSLPKQAQAEGRRPAPEARGGSRGPIDGGGGSGGNVREGRLSVNERGFGFVDVGEEEDFFLPPPEAAKALDGDRIRVRVHKRGGRTEAEFLGVVERQRSEVVGTYQVHGRDASVTPHDNTLPGVVRVPLTQLAQDGDVVRVRLEPPSPSGGGLSGEVMGSLGRPGEPSQDVLALVVARGFSDTFPAAVMDAAARVGPVVSEEEARAENRRDLRGLQLVTIDGADARDFDDAVWADELPGGITRLVVAIADVSHYVAKGSALDTEAFHRGTSVYLPDRVLPMLPERLSNGICSLRPHEDRLCLVADMEFAAGAVRRKATIYPAVMRSAARCTYEEVQAALDGAAVPGKEALTPLFRRLATLALALRKMREARGALDFDLPETKVVVDASGRPVRMERRERKDSHRLVEECMLAANEAVAAFFQSEGLPSVYRFHGEPDEAKLEAFAELGRAHGLTVPGGTTPTSLELNRFIQELEGKPEQRALNQVLLRSMMQAVYSPDSVGHYGLAADEYLHFTSPIRRYPDLLVHRLLRAHWQRRGQGRGSEELEKEVDSLRTMATRASERERAAMQVERDVTSFYAALLMQPRVGETFRATVSGVTDFGVFVELDEEHVEGLVSSDALGTRSRFDERLHALVLGDGRRVRVGQAATVLLRSVNLARRQLDFALVDWGTGPAEMHPGADSAHPGFDEQRARSARRAGASATRSQQQKKKHLPSHQPPRGAASASKKKRRGGGASRGGGGGGGARGGGGGGARGGGSGGAGGRGRRRRR